MEKLTLKSLRINAGLGQKEAAKALDISNKTLSNWENGKSFPSQPMIEKICSLYNTSYDFIDFSRF